MRYQSIYIASTYAQWLIGMASAIIILRMLYIIHSMTTSPAEGITFGTILEKVSKYLKAIIIAVIVESLIQIIKQYFFH